MDKLQRFSNRVENYIRFRPGYPDEVAALLLSDIPEHALVADVGSGTGILSELLLRKGFTVFGIEPNKEMRNAAERFLGSWSTFHSIDGTAESTGLPDKSVDAVIAAQAFHWFDKKSAKSEFRRILKTGGKVFLVWNDRRTQNNDFLQAYEKFIVSFATDYTEVNHKNIDTPVFLEFFGNANYKTTSFSNLQKLDFEGLKGRVLSSSYMPDEGSPQFEAMSKDLRSLFDRHQQDGTVTIEYDTRVYYGTIA